MRALLFLSVAALLAGSFLFHVHEERRLTRDWQVLRRSADAFGLELAGHEEGRSGWPYGASLSIDQPTLSLGGAAGQVSANSILLRRALPDPAALFIAPQGTLTLSAAATRRRLWARRLAVWEDADRVWKLAADRLDIALGSGPDDVALVETGRASLVSSEGGLRLALSASDIMLPLSSVPMVDRRIASVSLDGALTFLPGNWELAITRSELTWDGVTAQVTGRLRWRNGSPSGQLLMDLGPGWRTAIERAGASGLISPPQARAAIGLLSLLSAGGRARLPLAVQEGRVTLGGLALVVLPSFGPFDRNHRMMKMSR